MSRSVSFRFRVIAGALLTATAMTACAPLLIGGAMVGTTMVAIDRRTSGAQLDDESIEIKARNRVNSVIGDGDGGVSTTSYNRIVLLTGEVRTEAFKEAIGREVSGIDNVRSVVNEIAVAGTSSITSRSGDAIVSGKVKASLVDAKDLQANAIKVVTERGTVYLMGVVTEREANRAAEVARGVSGVQKVVRVFEIISEAELANLQPKARN